MPTLTSCYEIGLDEIGQEESDRQIIPTKGNSLFIRLFFDADYCPIVWSYPRSRAFFIMGFGICPIAIFQKQKSKSEDFKMENNDKRFYLKVRGQEIEVSEEVYRA